MKMNFDIKLVMAMVQMQDEMNTIVLGKDWVDGELHPSVDFVTAMAAEAGEFPDHLAFKWWKKQEPDVHQAKLELVDIYHFMISQIVQIHYGKLKQLTREKAIAPAALKKLASDATVATLQSGVIESIYDTRAGENIDRFKGLGLEQRRKNICSALRHAVMSFDLISINDKMSGENSPTLESILIEGVQRFTSVCEMLEMSFGELYLNYVGKNVLNKFRQENGYKEGAYVKIWNGLEDNQVLESFIKTIMKLDKAPDEDFKSAAHAYLTKSYPNKQVA